MEIRLLGPVEVRSGGRVLAITAARQRAVLAGLACRAGTTVPTEQIVADLWGDAPPDTALPTLRNYVRRLRQILPDGVLATTAGGYELAVDPADVDVLRFEQLIDRARATGSSELYDGALRLWRGAPLSDLGDLPLRRALAPRWEEAYLSAVEESVDLRLARGDHAGLVARLADLTGRHPLRERLCRQLMVVLYRTGRAADALAHYRRVRQRMVTELGMEPGQELRSCHEAILRDDAAQLHGIAARSAGSPVAHVPGRLPAPAAPFVGREAELAELRGRFGAGAGPVRCFLYGQGGSGKSALAIRLGHDLADRYPDGAVYLDLQGATPGAPTRTPAEVVGALVGALSGRPGGAETDVGTNGELDALLRTLRLRLTGRRVLVILDNAASAEQVRAALPDEPGCAAIVTSRAPISAGGSVFYLDPLRESSAVDLFARIAGGRRVRAERAAAARIAELCGRLPLAVRIVATRAALRPHWPLRAWVRLLEDERTRLDTLRSEDVDVRASFLVGLDGLRESDSPSGRDAVRLFPLLGVLHAPYATPALAAALTGWPESRAEDALERLLDAQMLFSPGPGRYRPYDLIVALARERGAALPEQERRAALARAVGWYEAAAAFCSWQATGGTGDREPRDAPEPPPEPVLDVGGYQEVRHWLDRELALITAVLREASAAGVPGTVRATRAVLHALPFYLNSALPWNERAALATLLLDDPCERPFGYLHLAIVQGQQGRSDNALAYLDAAAQAGPADPYTEMVLTSTRGIVLGGLGEIEPAVEHFRRAIALAERHRNPLLQAIPMNNLGYTLIRLGRVDEALQTLEQALAINRRLGHQLNIAINLNTMLQALSRRGDHVDVLRRAPDVLAEHERLGDAHQRAEHLLTTAKSLRSLGDDEAADRLTQEAHRCLTVLLERGPARPNEVFGHLVLDMP